MRRPLQSGVSSAQLLLLMLASSVDPMWAQPKQAVPVRTFPPGVQLESPVPINRGSDSLGLEGFLEPSQRYGTKKLTDSAASLKQGEVNESEIEADSMFGYDKKKDEVIRTKESENIVESSQSEISSEGADISEVFASEAEGDCSSFTASEFCNAFK